MKKSIRKKWTLSITIVVVAILIVIMLFNNIAISIINKEIVRINNTSKDFLLQGVDRRLVEIENVTIEMELNSQLQKLLRVDDEGMFSNAKVLSVTQMLRNAIIANEFIQSVFIYYPSHDRIVGNLGSFASRAYYHLTDGLNAEGYEEWITLVRDSERLNYILQIDKDGVPQLYFRHKTPVGMSESGEQAILMVKINHEEVRSVLSLLLKNQPRNYLALTDTDGRVYLFAGDESMAQYINFENGTGALREDFSYVTAPSHYTNLQYVIISNNAEILAPTRRVTLFSYVALAGCLALGILLSVFVSRRHSRPLEQLAGTLHQGAGPAEEAVDEYTFIERRVKQIVEQNQETIRKNEELGWALRTGFVKEVLRTNQKDEIYTIMMGSRYGLSFDWVYFRFLVFALQEADTQDADQLLQWMRQTAEPLEETEELLAMPALLGNKAVFLLNFETEEKSYIDEIVLRFSALVGRELAYAASPAFSSAAQFADFFEQTQEKLMPQGAKSSVEDALRATQTAETLFYNWRRRLELGEFAQAAELFEDLFEAYVLNIDDQYTQRVHKYALISVLLASVEQRQRQTQSETLLEWAKEQLQSSVDLTALSQNICAILYNMEQSNQEYLDRHKENLIYKVKSILDKNYAEAYMGLYYLSDKTKASSSYISRAFKKEFGIGITHYMNQLRIEKAKQLISQEQISIKDVAQQVGFTSDINFIRVFKKYEEVTPGAYRKTDGAEG